MINMARKKRNLDDKVVIQHWCPHCEFQWLGAVTHVELEKIATYQGSLLCKRCNKDIYKLEGNEGRPSLY